MAGHQARDARFGSGCPANDHSWNEEPMNEVGSWQRDLCHIRVRFTCPPLELDFQDDRAVADRFAAAAYKVGAAVTIDNNLSDSWPPLPCHRLWT
jgi:hypothetical protein